MVIDFKPTKFYSENKFPHYDQNFIPCNSGIQPLGSSTNSVPSHTIGVALLVLSIISDNLHQLGMKRYLAGIDTFTWK